MMKKFRFIWFIFLLAMTECKGQSPESNIVLINIRQSDRGDIAEVVRIINSFKPKVIAIDAVFPEDGDYEKDNKLIGALFRSKNLVMPSMIDDFDGLKMEYERFQHSSNIEFLMSAETGFTNVILENDDLNTLKRFSTMERVKGRIEYHFAIRTAMEFDSLQTMLFLKGNPKISEVDYKNGQRKFRTFKASDVIGKKISDANIRGKIVMMGDMGQLDYDLFFTPLNAQKGPNESGMYGVEILANIVAQILEYKDK